MTDAAAAAGPTRTFSEILVELGESDKPGLSIGEMMEAFGERGFGAAMLVVALINSFPWPPGGTTILGIPLLVLCIGLTAGRKSVWLPKWLNRVSVNRAAYRGFVQRFAKPLRYVERITRPRLTFLVSGIAERIIGAVCVLLCIVMILPIPFGNMPPAIAITLYALALMQRDGIALFAALLANVYAVVILILFWGVVWAVLSLMLGWLGLSGG